MTEAEIVSRTRSYIKENFLYARPDFELDDEAGLLGLGIIDSMGVMELIEFIQTEFRIEIADDDITEDNLGTVAAISRYVVARAA